MIDAGDILVVGGYGVVGRRICARLASRYPGRVIVAGRNLRAAADLCESLGNGARPRVLDVNDRSSVSLGLQQASLVVSCIDQREPHLLGASVTSGLAYTDIAPHLAFRRDAGDLHAEARRTGACILLGAGLEPGISSVLARAAAERIGPLHSLQSALLLSLGDEFGPASLAFILETITDPFTILQDGREHSITAFAQKASIDFPPPFGRRTAYAFPFSDVAFYPKTLGVRTSVGRLALDPPWVGALAAGLVRLGAASWLRRPGLHQGHRRTIDALKRLYSGRDRFALLLQVTGERGMARASLTGHHQAEATAIGAAELCSMLYEGQIQEPGVWLPEQVVDPGPFLERIASHGLRTSLELAG